MFYPYYPHNKPCTPLVQGIFRDQLPDSPDSDIFSFISDSREILSLPLKDEEYPGGLINPRMNSALIAPVYFYLDFQGTLFLNSLYEKHYDPAHICELEKLCLIDRLRLLCLQEELH